MSEKSVDFGYLLSPKLDTRNIAVNPKNKPLPRLIPYPVANSNEFGLDSDRFSEQSFQVLPAKTKQDGHHHDSHHSTKMVTNSNYKSKSKVESNVSGERDFEETGANSSGDKQGSSRLNIFGKSIAEKMYFFTGSAERVIKWHKIFNMRPCFFEVIASVVSMQDGSVKLQRIILLRDDKGPIIQVIHYLTNDIQLEDFTVGQKLSRMIQEAQCQYYGCVGHMTGHNILNAISIRLATQDEVATLQRHCYVGDYAISRMLNEERNAEASNLLLR